jgi:hypothetical protein
MMLARSAQVMLVRLFHLQGGSHVAEIMVVSHLLISEMALDQYR